VDRRVQQCPISYTHHPTVADSTRSAAAAATNYRVWVPCNAAAAAAAAIENSPINEFTLTF